MDIDNCMHVLFDRNVFGPPRNAQGDIEYSVVDEDDLFDATNAVASRNGNAYYGYYKNLTGTADDDPGAEKIPFAFGDFLWHADLFNLSAGIRDGVFRQYWWWATVCLEYPHRRVETD